MALMANKGKSTKTIDPSYLRKAAATIPNGKSAGYTCARMTLGKTKRGEVGHARPLLVEYVNLPAALLLVLLLLEWHPPNPKIPLTVVSTYLSQRVVWGVYEMMCCPAMARSHISLVRPSL